MAMVDHIYDEVERSNTAKASATQDSFVREIQALMAFGDLEWFEAVALAEADLPQALEILAASAARWQVAPDPQDLASNPAPDAVAL